MFGGVAAGTPTLGITPAWSDAWTPSATPYLRAMKLKRLARGKGVNNTSGRFKHGPERIIPPVKYLKFLSTVTGSNASFSRLHIHKLLACKPGVALREGGTGRLLHLSRGMLSRKASTISGLAYIALVLVLTFFIGLSCALLLSQAVRTSPGRNWTRNFNAVVIGAAYAIVVSTCCAESTCQVASSILCRFYARSLSCL